MPFSIVHFILSFILIISYFSTSNQRPTRIQVPISNLITKLASRCSSYTFKGFSTLLRSQDKISMSNFDAVGEMIASWLMSQYDLVLELISGVIDWLEEVLEPIMLGSWDADTVCGRTTLEQDVNIICERMSLGRDVDTVFREGVSQSGRSSSCTKDSR